MRTPSRSLALRLRLSHGFFLLVCGITLFAATQASAMAVISEVLWAGSDASPFDEWVEISGIGTGTSLAGWRLTGVNSKGVEVDLARFGTGAMIGSGEVLVIARFPAAQSRLAAEPFLVTPAMGLPNTKLLLRLRSASGAIMDAVDDGIGDPFAGSTAGSGVLRASMERIDLRLAGTVKAHWNTATVRMGFKSGALVLGTPGYRYRGTPAGSSSSVHNFSSSSSVSSVCTSSGTVIQCDDTVKQSSSSSSYQRQNSSESSRSSQSSSSAMPEDAPTAPVCPDTFATGVRISEILPTSGRTGDAEEWVEIENTNHRPVDLCGWSLDDAVKGSKPFPLTGWKLGPKRFLVLRPSQTRIAWGDKGDSIRLFGPDQSMLDEVVYTAGPRHQSFARSQTGGFLWTPFATPGGANRFEAVQTPRENVIVSAALPNPEGDDDGKEWIELMNMGADPVNIDGWKLTANRVVLLPLIRLEAGERRVFPADELKVQLRNSSGAVSLLHREGSELSRLRWLKAEAGDVYRRVAADASPLRARLQTAGSGVVTVELLDQRMHQPDSVAQFPVDFFQMKIASALLKNKKTDLQIYSIEGILQAMLPSELVALASEIAPSESQEAAPADGASEEASSNLVTGKLLLSEVMTRPLPDGEEWVEIYNADTADIPLRGWVIADGAKKAPKSPFTTEQIAPKQYLAFPAPFLKLKLNNDGEAMALVDPFGVVVDGAAVPKLKEGQTYARPAMTRQSWCVAEPTAEERNRCIELVVKSKEPSLKAKKSSKKVDQKKKQPAALSTSSTSEFPAPKDGAAVTAQLLQELEQKGWEVDAEQSGASSQREAILLLLLAGVVIIGIVLIYRR